MKKFYKKFLIGLSIVIPISISATSCNVLPLPGLPGSNDNDDTNLPDIDNGNDNNPDINNPDIPGGNTNPDNGGNTEPDNPGGNTNPGNPGGNEGDSTNPDHGGGDQSIDDDFPAVGTEYNPDDDIITFDDLDPQQIGNAPKLPATNDCNILEKPTRPNLEFGNTPENYDDKFIFQYDALGVVINSYIGNPDEVIIRVPKEINGRTVYAINPGAFTSNPTALLNRIIHVPQTVEWLGSDCFLAEDIIATDAYNASPSWTIEDKITNNQFYNATRAIDLIISDQYLIKAYTLEKTCTILKYFEKENVNDITIPLKINDLDVTAIYKNAFANCLTLNKVTLNKNIENIYDMAFAGCINLQSFTVEEESVLTVVGGKAFQGCVSLVNVSLPDSVTHIIGGAFNDCGQIQNFRFPMNAYFNDESFENTTIKNLSYTGHPTMYNAQIGSSVHPALENAEIAINYINEEINLVGNAPLQTLKNGQLVNLKFEYSPKNSNLIKFYQYKDFVPTYNTHNYYYPSEGIYQGKAIVVNVGGNKYLSHIFDVIKIKDEVVTKFELVNYKIPYVDKHLDEIKLQPFIAQFIVRECKGKYIQAEDQYDLENRNTSPIYIDNGILSANVGDEVIGQLTYKLVRGKYIATIKNGKVLNQREIYNTNFEFNAPYKCIELRGATILALAKLTPSSGTHGIAYLFNYKNLLPIGYLNIRIGMIDAKQDHIYAIKCTIGYRYEHEVHDMPNGTILKIKDVTDELNDFNSEAMKNMLIKATPRQATLSQIYRNFNKCFGKIFKVNVAATADSNFVYQGNDPYSSYFNVDKGPYLSALPIPANSELKDVLCTPTYWGGHRCLRFLKVRPQIIPDTNQQ